MKDGRLRVRVDNVFSEPFEIASGLKQGDALSFVFLNIILEKAVRSAHIKT